VFVTVILGVEAESRVALYTIPVWAVVLIGGYLLARPGMVAREAAAATALQQQNSEAANDQAPTGDSSIDLALRG
jgi:hypothetical protein